MSCVDCGSDPQSLERIVQAVALLRSCILIQSYQVSGVVVKLIGSRHRMGSKVSIRAAFSREPGRHYDQHLIGRRAHRRMTDDAASVGGMKAQFGFGGHR
jgi:hypothetical protein